MTSSYQTRSTGSSSNFPFGLGCQEAYHSGEVSGAPGFLLGPQCSTPLPLLPLLLDSVLWLRSAHVLLLLTVEDTYKTDPLSHF